MYTFPRPSEREMELSYPNDYFAYHVGRPRSSWSAKLRRAVQLSFAPNLGRKEHNAKRLRWNAAMSRIPILGRLFELGIFAPFGDRALVDIGCGAGHFLSKMRAIGWDVIGADRCEQAADRAMKSLGIPVVVGNFPEVDLPDESFDLVTAWQVLEHLDRPRPSLARMRRLLRPDGKLIITVPNQAGWGAKRFGADWIGNDLPRHLTHFSRQTLARMLEAEGFEILFLGAIPQSGWVRRSARQLETSRTSFTNSLLKHRLASTLYTTAAGFCGASETLLAIATSKIS